MPTLRLTLFLLLSCISLYSEEPFDVEMSTETVEAENDNSLVDAHLTGLPSAIVNQVNIITGTYHDHHVDLTVHGAQPIEIQRNYSSHYNRDHWFDPYRTLSNGWGFDHNNAIKLNYTKFWDGKEHKHSKLSVESMEGGSCLLYKFPNKLDGKHKHKEPLVLKISSEVKLHGLTNCGGGTISGRTNIKNTRLIERDYKGEYPYFEMCTGAGVVYTYEELKSKSQLQFLKKIRHLMAIAFAMNMKRIVA